MDREIARTGSELWYELVEIAGLDTQTSYDRDIVDQVGRALGLSWGSDFGEEIERAGKDATAVLVAVLGALQPWAQMMRDLLELMASCGANTTRTQLRAEVDVASASEHLDLDLSSFTEAIEQIDEIVTMVEVARWSHNEITELAAMLPRADKPQWPRLRPEVQAWLTAYERDPDVFPVPSPTPPPPSSGDPALDRALAAAWSAWRAAVQVAASLPTRRDLHQAGRSRAKRMDEHPDLAWIAVADTDHLWGHLASGLDEVARRVRGGDWSEWDRPAWGSGRSSPADLIDLVDRLPTASAEAAEPERKVHELLSLPVWKHRYDIYSNWVFTQIVAGLREVVDIRVEHDDGRIDFGFGSARMAASDSHEIAVYGELRSPLKGPSGKRKHDVQPDYSILVGDSTDPAASSRLEIECKQYKRASRKNFSEALQDYARARPRAVVVLVSYGPMSQRVQQGILGAVDAGLRDRCRLIGEMRPDGEDGGRDGPRRELAKNLTVGLGLSPSPSAPLPKDARVTIDLRWSAIAVDLDLHLEIGGGPDSPESVASYRRPIAGEDGHAKLVEDIREGPGPERLTITRWFGRTYRLWVHRFDDAELDACEPHVVLSTGGEERTFECPAGNGPWWLVFEVDGATGAVSQIGEREQRQGKPEHFRG